MMSSSKTENLRSVESIRRDWANKIEQDILDKRSEILRQKSFTRGFILFEPAEYEDQITLASLLKRKYYTLWWREFVSRYPGVTIMIFLLSMTIGVLLGLR